MLTFCKNERITNKTLFIINIKTQREYTIHIKVFLKNYCSATVNVCNIFMVTFLCLCTKQNRLARELDCDVTLELTYAVQRKSFLPSKYTLFHSCSDLSGIFIQNVMSCTFKNYSNVRQPMFQCHILRKENRHRTHSQIFFDCQNFPFKFFYSSMLIIRSKIYEP